MPRVDGSSKPKPAVLSGDEVLALALLGAGLALGLAGTALGVLGGSGWGLFGSMISGAVLTGGVVLSGLAVRGRVLRREALRDQWQRELRYLAAWSSEEGILRKAGLIRDLSALQTVGLPLEQMLLAGADLSGCILARADLRGADLRRANLQGAVLDAADLTGADLTEANLGMASLKGATLRGCTLEGANLAKAELEGASLARAYLVNANVHGVDFTHTLLDRTRFALREASDFAAQVHPSVEDWIRERLDGRGFYTQGAATADKGEAGLGETDSEGTKARAGGSER